MFKKGVFIFMLIGGILVQVGAAGSKETETKELTVFIAASTTDLIQEAGDLFLKKTGIKLNTNPASSGTLARQIEQGASPDLYISASKKWIDYVEELGVISRQAPFVKNRLVLIAPADSPLTSFELTKETDFLSLFSGRLSMGDPAHVPAGKYGEEALKYFGWYDSLKDRLQLATDVRAALLVVEMGETELGIVYETDAIKSAKVKILASFPEESHTPVEYFCALLENPKPEAQKLYDFLTTDEDALKLYGQYGFSPAE